MSMKSVGVAIINDEILKDQKCDSVSRYLIEQLNSLQYVINRITLIPNSESVIRNELEPLIKTCDIILAISNQCSSLFKCAGRMISQELVPNENLAEFHEANGGSCSHEALIPIQVKLLQKSNIFPVAHFQRIFFLKEQYLRQSFEEILKPHLIQYRGRRIFQKVIHVSQNGNTTNDLNAINKLSNDSVTLDFSKNDEYFIFRISSPDLSHMVRFEEKIKETIDLYRLRFADESDEWERVYSSNENNVKNAIENIELCLGQYGPDNIFVSFNGGKDCTVLLHLVLTVLKKKYPNYTQPIFCLYVQSDRPFPEQDEFIDQARTFYNLKIMTIRSGIKDALKRTLDEFPNIGACFMGTRRTDPYSGDLNVFQMTDSNWPKIMRVSPLLDWHYCDVWDYLLYYKVPYCKLYDMGFTSLGNTVNTTRNPSLVYYDRVEKKEMFLPAYKLLKEEKERNGRNSS